MRLLLRPDLSVTQSKDVAMSGQWEIGLTAVHSVERERELERSPVSSQTMVRWWTTAGALGHLLTAQLTVIQTKVVTTNGGWAVGVSAVLSVGRERELERSLAFSQTTIQ